MKKKLYMMALVVVLAVLATGCGKKDSKKDVLRNDIVEFVNEELPAIQADRDNAIDIYNSYFTAENADMDKFLADLKDNALTDMETYIANLSAIEVSTDEVAELKELYLQSSRKQYEAMKLVISAIEGEKPEYLTQADGLIEESRSLLIQYESQLKLLAVDNGITINGTFTSSEVSGQSTEEVTSEEASAEAQ